MRRVRILLAFAGLAFIIVSVSLGKGLVYVKKENLELVRHHDQLVIPTSSQLEPIQLRHNVSNPSMYEALAPHHTELEKLRHTNAFKILMRDQSVNIKKEGWETESDSLLKSCRQRDYGDLSSWPKASIIIAFCNNEHVSDVLRTVHSIVQRTPDVLVQEILLVDDNSVKEEFRETFHIYIAAVFGDKVKVIRSDKSLGLIQARLAGARSATGDVIVSMDAHMEVQDTWLEALIWEIRVNKKTLATGALDWIILDGGTGVWTYRTGYSSFMCTFGWSLGFGFGYSRPEFDQAWKKDNTMAIPSPCTVGGIFAIDVEFFKEIGELDEGMEKWGGENLDLAIRTWLFGGRAVQVPCSHVAHVERPGQRDYRAGWDKHIDRNYKRVIDVWFDDAKKYVFRENPKLKNIDAGDVTSRLKVKQRALHTFDWYLDHVFPELGVYDRNSLGYGSLKNLAPPGLMCIHRVGGNPLELGQCTDDFKWDVFLTYDGYLRTDLHTWHAKTRALGSVIGPEGCTGTFHEPWLSQWIHWKDGPMMLYEGENGIGTSKSLCMHGYHNASVSLQKCDVRSLNQRWQWKVYPDHYHNVLNGTYHSPYHMELLRIKTLWEKLKSQIVS